LAILRLFISRHFAMADTKDTPLSRETNITDVIKSIAFHFKKTIDFFIVKAEFEFPNSYTMCKTYCDGRKFGRLLIEVDYLL
jgi:hypothetical protein